MFVRLKKALNKMERIAISKTHSSIKSGEYIVDGLMLSNQKVCIEIEVNSKTDILLNNIKDILELIIDIDKDSDVTLSFLSEEEMKESNIVVNVKNNSTISGFFADFSDNFVDFVETTGQIKKIEPFLKLFTCHRLCFG